jgi:hypothetical protein
LPTPPTGEQKQKKRTTDVLPKPDNLIRYRQDLFQPTTPWFTPSSKSRLHSVLSRLRRWCRNQEFRSKIRSFDRAEWKATAQAEVDEDVLWPEG